MFSGLFLLVKRKKKQVNTKLLYWLSWPGTWYSLTSQQDEKQSGGDRRIGTSADHARISRAVQGRGLTINTLPDNMTRIAVSGRPQAFLLMTPSNVFWFVLAGLANLSFCSRVSHDFPVFTSPKEDSEKYYTWRSFGPADPRTQELWVDTTGLRRADVRVHGILSNSYKQASVSGHEHRCV